MTTEHEAPTENYDDENPHRTLEPHTLQVGEIIAIDGACTLRFDRHDGKVRLLFAGVASTDVLVRKPGGGVYRLRDFP